MKKKRKRLLGDHVKVSRVPGIQAPSVLFSVVHNLHFVDQPSGPHFIQNKGQGQTLTLYKRFLAAARNTCACIVLVGESVAHTTQGQTLHSRGLWALPQLKVPLAQEEGEQARGGSWLSCYHVESMVRRAGHMISVFYSILVISE